MKWSVKIHGRVAKALLRLSPTVQDAFRLLYQDLEQNGPEARQWPNYGKLKGMRRAHHCHFKKGRPTYVAVWWEVKEDHSIEVTYVGTHEKAPY